MSSGEQPLFDSLNSTMIQELSSEFTVTVFDKDTESLKIFDGLVEIKSLMSQDVYRRRASIKQGDFLDEMSFYKVVYLQ